MIKYFLTPLLLLFAFLSIEAKNPLNFYANKAEEALSKGQYEDALDYARQEMADYESNPNGYYQAALSLYALNQPGQALTMINKALEKAKKDKSLAGRCYGAKSELLKELGDTIQSLAALNEGLKIDGNNVDLLIERGHTLISTDKKGALKDLQKAKKLTPTDPRPYIYTAYLYTTQNNYKEALDEITRAISLDNTISYSYSLRGLILKELGYSPDWIRDCLKSYELDPEASFGASLLGMSDDNETRSLIIKEIEANHSASNGYYSLEAFLLYAWQNYALAVSVFEEMINLGIADLSTYICLADCQQRLGYILDAYTTASNGLQKYPDDLALKFAKAQVGVMVGKADEVMWIIDSLIAQSPEEAALYLEKGRALMSLGRYAEAVEPFATAVMLNPSVNNKLHYGDALRLSGNKTKANAEYVALTRRSNTEIEKEGQIPQYVYAMAFSGLGEEASAIHALEAWAKDNTEIKNTYLPMIYTRLGLKQKAIRALENYSKEYKWNAILDLYSYNFHPLHTEPDFEDLLAENGVKTHYNNQTHLLEYVPGNVFQTSGGTSFEEVMNLLSESPSDWVKKFNQLCPVDMGIGGQITSVDFDEQSWTVTYNCLVNPLGYNFKMLNDNPVYKMKKEDIIALGFISENPGIVDIGLTFRYNMRASDDSGQCWFNLTPGRMKELLKKIDSQDEIDKMTLDFWIEEESLAFLENETNHGGSVKLDGKNIIYTYPTSEEDGTLSHIELFKSDIKNQLSNLFKDPSMMTRIPVYLRQNLTLKFIYLGKTTGKTIEITFTPEEIANSMK